MSTTDELRASPRSGQGGGEERLRRGVDVQDPAVVGRDDPHLPVRAHPKARMRRRSVDGLSQALEVGGGVRATDLELRPAEGREPEQLRDLRRPRPSSAMSPHPNRTGPESATAPARASARAPWSAPPAAIVATGSSTGSREKPARVATTVFRASSRSSSIPVADGTIRASLPSSSIVASRGLCSTAAATWSSSYVRPAS